MTNFWWVALGGAIGACARYAVSLNLASNDSKAFPFATLVVNISGSFLLALLLLVLPLVGMQSTTQQSLWLLFGVGVLGSFTTFSTFSLEWVQLWQQQLYSKAMWYVGANLIGCIAAVALVLWLHQLCQQWFK